MSHTATNDVFSEEDRKWMRQALELAEQGVYSTKPNPTVGCVLVKNATAVGQGWHRKAGEPHAERVALAEAGMKAHGATAYVTLEPCSHHGRTPPCADGLIEAGIQRVVVAMLDPNPLVAGQGVERIRQAGIRVDVGLFEAEARTLNPGFIQVMETGFPLVRVKMASSLDGRTAMANGESQWITGAEAREDVHKLRARSGAIITGIGTVLADDPSLTVRLPDSDRAVLNLEADDLHPLRVVLDPNLSLPLDAKMLSLPGRTIVMTSRETADREAELTEDLIERGLELVAVAAEEDRLDIESVLRYLAEEEEVREVMVESGAIVAGAFMQSGFVNELYAYMAPVLMGDQARPMFVLPGLESMQDKLQYQIRSVTQLGEDVRLILTPKGTDH